MTTTDPLDDTSQIISNKRDLVHPPSSPNVTLKSFEDDEQDETPSIPTQVAPKSNRPSSSDMIFYYERLLPFKQVFQWLNHSPKPTKDFTMREFAYEYRSGAYQRYNSYSSAEEFKDAVVKANPTRFEVGAVYAINPKDRKTVPKTAMKPLQKELVFDIDLTDYDEIRTCCSGTDICTKCWKFITVAIKIIHEALSEDFGFKHMMWVFSGRRGAHCWISDKRARQLDETQRRAIVEYLNVLKGKTGKKLNVRRPFHPLVERSFGVLSAEFQDMILFEQDPWRDDKKAVEELLKYLPDQNLINGLKIKWSKSPGRSSSQKWKDIDEVAKSTLDNKFKATILLEAKKDIILDSMYPRLDVEVSRQMIHLLKSPFCIHPSTGNICVPFEPTKVFDPTSGPNLRQLQDEIEQWESKAAGNDSPRKILDYEKTSLKPYVEYFKEFVNELLKEELHSVKRERETEESMEF